MVNAQENLKTIQKFCKELNLELLNILVKIQLNFQDIVQKNLNIIQKFYKQ